MCVGSVATAGCSSDFRSCNETRTCPRGGAAGIGGDGGEAGEDAGGSSNAGHGGAAVNTAGDTGAAGDGGAAGEESGGSDANGGAAGHAGATTSDTTAPTIVSIVPADGAKGIALDAKIVVTFSEAVDKASAEAALTSSVGNVNVAWNAAGTALTATPATLLSYPTDGSTKSYSVQFGTDLKDSAGNHLAAAFSSSFSTLRQLTAKLSRPVLGLVSVSDYPSIEVAEADASLFIGDTPGNTYDRAFPYFDISSLPAATTTIVSAKMSIPISLRIVGANDVDTGKPFTDLGNLLVEHVYDWPIQFSSLTKPPLSSVGTLMTAATAMTGVSTIEVTAAVMDDFTNRVARGNRSMYRLFFPKTTDNDSLLDSVTIPFNGTVALDITYLVP